MGGQVWGILKISNKTTKDNVPDFSSAAEEFLIPVQVNEMKRTSFMTVYKPGSDKVLHKSILIPKTSWGIYRCSFGSLCMEVVCVVLAKFKRQNILFYHYDSKKQG